jgi:CYTH domain-containing protein
MESHKTYELERKFLLKSLPNIKCTKELKIYQYYLNSEPLVAKRIRRSICGDVVNYYYTEKIYDTTNSEHTEEIEKIISVTEFNKLKNKAISLIKKTRRLYNDGTKDWEIDIFDDMSLIIAEIEFIANGLNVHNKSYELNNYKIPNFINEVLIMEVSNMKEFSNKELALII